MLAKKRMFLVVLVLGTASTFASGSIIADLNNPVSYSIADVTAAGGIIVGDKLFDGFRVTTTSSSGTIAPGPDAIAVTGIQIQGDYGLRFNGPWSAAAGQLADSTIKFRASIIEPWVSQGWVLKDNALWMTAMGVSPTLDGGMVSVSENVYAFDPDLGFSQPIANKFVYYINDNNNNLYDERDFADAGGLVQLPEVWVIKDVVTNGGLPQGVGVAHLSEFFQTFSQVPEPGTFSLLVLGGLGILVRKRR